MIASDFKLALAAIDEAFEAEKISHVFWEGVMYKNNSPADFVWLNSCPAGKKREIFTMPEFPFRRIRRETCKA